jgi:hypothetical protein
MPSLAGTATAQGYLAVKDTGSRSWLLRYERQGRERWMGLGSAEFVPLAEARDKAYEARRQLRQGIDPLDARQTATAQARVASLKTITFEEAARQCVDARSTQWRSAKWGAEWISTLERHTFPTLGSLPVSAIDTALVHRVLDPVWRSSPKSGERVRHRIAAVLEWARVRGYREGDEGDNPARRKGHLKHTLPKARRVQHHPALPYPQAPAFMAELRSVSGVAARALEFVILTAVRASAARALGRVRPDGARLDASRRADENRQGAPRPSLPSRGRRCL